MANKPPKTEYEKALDEPRRSGVGWAHANADSMRAARAQALGIKHCLTGAAIYEWSKRRAVNLNDSRVLGPLVQTVDLLLVAVLNDLTLQGAEELLATAQNA